MHIHPLPHHHDDPIDSNTNSPEFGGDATAPGDTSLTSDTSVAQAGSTWTDPNPSWNDPVEGSYRGNWADSNQGSTDYADYANYETPKPVDGGPYFGDKPGWQQGSSGTWYHIDPDGFYDGRWANP